MGSKILGNAAKCSEIVSKIDIKRIIIRDETIWRYIDTVSIRRVTIRIVAQRDISRYDLDIYKEGKSLRCLYFFVFV